MFRKRRSFSSYIGSSKNSEVFRILKPEKNKAVYLRRKRRILS